MSKTQNIQGDTRELSREPSKINTNDARDHMMVIEVGALQRIADSLERIERLGYAMLLEAMDTQQPPKLSEAIEAELRAFIERTSQRGGESDSEQESEPSCSSELAGDHPDHHGQGPSQG